MNTVQDVKNRIQEIIKKDPCICTNATLIYYSSDFLFNKGKKKTCMLETTFDSYFEIIPTRKSEPKLSPTSTYRQSSSGS